MAGSSGSPVVNINNEIVGQLYGDGNVGPNARWCVTVNGNNDYHTYKNIDGEFAMTYKEIADILGTVSPPVTPTATPSASPTVSKSWQVPTMPSPDCEDNATFEFNLDNVIAGVRYCAWLTQHPDRDIDTKRIGQYCNRPEIKMACKGTCDFCTCVDNTDFEFILVSGEFSQKCEWIDTNSKRVRTRRSKYCFTDEDGVEIITNVGKQCPSACGLCK